jgi:hypothetical protein
MIRKTFDDEKLFVLLLKIGILSCVSTWTACQQASNKQQDQNPKVSQPLRHNATTPQHHNATTPQRHSRAQHSTANHPNSRTVEQHSHQCGELSVVCGGCFSLNNCVDRVLVGCWACVAAGLNVITALTPATLASERSVEHQPCLLCSARQASNYISFIAVYKGSWLE